MANQNSNDTALKAGAAAAATAAAAAAAAYWFYGAKDAAKHRKQAKSFMLKARADVLDAVEAAVEKVGEIDKQKYLAIVNQVVKNYAGKGGATSAQVTQMAKDLKGAWAHMQKASKEANRAGKAAKKVAKKAKKAAKKKR